MAVMMIGGLIYSCGFGFLVGYVCIEKSKELVGFSFGYVCTEKSKELVGFSFGYVCTKKLKKLAGLWFSFEIKNQFVLEIESV